MTPEILYEDEHIIVCVKPAGIATQSSRTGTADMVSILINHIHKNESIKDISSKGGIRRSPYLAVLHRLDQPVEGILVFAKTPLAAKELNRQLTSSEFGKYYRALLIGAPDIPEDDLTDYLVKDGKTNTSQICTADTPGAKLACLHYKISESITLESGGQISIAEITLKTGRHHQIRVQMANMGCPIVGDRKYNQAGPDPFGLSLQLFAYHLTFRHPVTKKKMEFEIQRLTHESLRTLYSR